MSAGVEATQRVAATMAAMLTDHGITQRQAAARSGIARSTLARRLSGRSPLYIVELERLAALVDVPLWRVVERAGL